MNYEDKKIVGIIATNVDAATALNVIGHLSVADYPKDMLETRTDEVNEITGKFQLWRVE